MIFVLRNLGMSNQVLIIFSGFVLGRIEAKCWKLMFILPIFAAVFEIYNMYTILHCSKFKTFANVGAKWLTDICNNCW